MTAHPGSPGPVGIDEPLRTHVRTLTGAIRGADVASTMWNARQTTWISIVDPKGAVVLAFTDCFTTRSNGVIPIG